MRAVRPNSVTTVTTVSAHTSPMFFSAAASALPRVLRALVTVTATADDPAARSAPLETFADGSFERRLVDALIAPDARLLTAEDHGHVIDVLLAHERQDPGNQGHVRAGKYRQADRVRILLDYGLNDLVGRLMQPGVDDFHTGVA